MNIPDKENLNTSRDSMLKGGRVCGEKSLKTRGDNHVALNNLGITKK